MASSGIPDPSSVTSQPLTYIALISVITLLLIVAPITGTLVRESVKEGNVKVVKKWGVTAGTVFEPDAHFVNPVSQSTSSLSVRPWSYTMSSSTSEDDRCGDDAITVLSENDLRTDIDVTVRYRIDTGQTVEFHRSHQVLTIAEERLVRPSVWPVLRTEAGRPPIIVICAGGSQIQLKVIAERELTEEFADGGLILETVQVHNVGLLTEYARAIEQKEITERRRQQKQDELAVEELGAGRKRIEVQGQTDANRVLAESLFDEVLTQKYIRRLNETDTVYIPVGDGGYPQFVRSLDSDGLPSSDLSAGSSSDTTPASSRSSTSSGPENETGS